MRTDNKQDFRGFGPETETKREENPPMLTVQPFGKSSSEERNWLVKIWQAFEAVYILYKASIVTDTSTVIFVLELPLTITIKFPRINIIV